jgi:flagella basal body P-ring formation protein FlgA
MVNRLRQLERHTLIVVLAVMMVGSSATASPATVIALRPQATPESTIVRLGDVAEVRAENEREVERLSALPLMPAPASGTRRYLRMREVQDLLAAHGEVMSRLNFRGETVIEVVSPAAVSQPANDDEPGVHERRQAAWQGTTAATDTREERQRPSVSYDASRDELRRIIVEHLTRQAGQVGPWQVELSVMNRYLEMLPSATSPPQCEGGQPPWTGRQRFVISFPTAREKVNFSLSAEVTRPQSVVVAARPIERGAVVTAAHVELQERDSLPSAAGRRVPAGSVESLLGKEAARTIQAGQVLFDDDVQAPLLVKRGEDMTVYARSGGIQVRTIARARQDGARGELVQVESLDTRERYDAVVVGLREAVVFGGSSAPAANVAGRGFQSPRR